MSEILSEAHGRLPDTSPAAIARRNARRARECSFCGIVTLWFNQRMSAMRCFRGCQPHDVCDPCFVHEATGEYWAAVHSRLGDRVWARVRRCPRGLSEAERVLLVLAREKEPAPDPTVFDSGWRVASTTVGIAP